MIDIACKPPAENANFIVGEGLQYLGLFANPQPGSTLANFGLSVNQSMVCIESRVLTPPRIAYKAGQPNVRNAGWNVLGIKFSTPGDMSKWAVLLVRDPDRYKDQYCQFEAGSQELRGFLQAFSNKCQSCGMKVSQGPPTVVSAQLPSPRDDSGGRTRALEIIRNTLRTLVPQKPSFVLVLLAGQDKFIRPGLKKIADMELGLHTVCMLLPKARKDRGQDQYFSNVALKVNAKLGGVNHLLDAQSARWLNEKKTMFVGIDVTHPSPASAKGSPSIAAVVASADDKLVQYPVSLRLQTNRNVHKDAEEVCGPTN